MGIAHLLSGQDEHAGSLIKMGQIELAVGANIAPAAKVVPSTPPTCVGVFKSIFIGSVGNLVEVVRLLCLCGLRTVLRAPVFPRGQCCRFRCCSTVRVRFHRQAARRHVVRASGRPLWKAHHPYPVVAARAVQTVADRRDADLCLDRRGGARDAVLCVAVQGLRSSAVGTAPARPT